MEYFNICTKKQWEQDGEKKTKWLQAGTLRKAGDGKMFIELNHLPDVPFFVFEPKAKGNDSKAVDW